ncbi:unnamed protein product [Phytophthora fragariaefolia]|uniref:Unnamed protein product n=1 Tax=Phytophthora fragariaefolia TaxID=1490495 RepID=A0A9W7CT93_9STRA|nr:unnamed protein product [Phytophthora fragariaefolia]
MDAASSITLTFLLAQLAAALAPRFGGGSALDFRSFRAVSAPNLPFHCLPFRHIPLARVLVQTPCRFVKRAIVPAPPPAVAICVVDIASNGCPVQPTPEITTVCPVVPFMGIKYGLDAVVHGCPMFYIHLVTLAFVSSISVATELTELAPLPGSGRSHPSAATKSAYVSPGIICRWFTLHSAAEMSNLSPYRRKSAVFSVGQVRSDRINFLFIVTHHLKELSINLLPKMKNGSTSGHLPRPELRVPSRARPTRSIQVDTNTLGEGVDVGSGGGAPAGLALGDLAAAVVRKGDDGDVIPFPVAAPPVGCPGGFELAHARVELVHGRQYYCNSPPSPGMLSTTPGAGAALELTAAAVVALACVGDVVVEAIVVAVVVVVVVVVGELLLPRAVGVLDADLVRMRVVVMFAAAVVRSPETPEGVLVPCRGPCMTTL